MRNKYRKRTLVSFGGTCPLNCNHCFTKGLRLAKGEAGLSSIDSQIEAIANNLTENDCDIIYVSHNRENFVNEVDGLALCEALWRRLSKDIFVITRIALSDDTLGKLQELNLEMGNSGNHIYLATSIIGTNSYGVSERAGVCPSPEERMRMLERAHTMGIRTILMLRPVFPDSIIPTSECLDVIDRIVHSVDAVVASGLVLTDEIEQSLDIDFSSYRMMNGGDTSYLDSLPPESVRYVDVTAELGRIEARCVGLGTPFFAHTLPALNHIALLSELR